MSDEAARTFHRLAFQYCSDLDAAALDAAGVLRALLGLVEAALALPDVKPSDEEYDDPPDLEQCYADLAAKVVTMVDIDLYWEVFDPFVDEEPVTGSLCDDLADIYRDLRRGLHIAELGHLDDAIFEWRWHYLIHWGDHATDAIRVLHRLVSRQRRSG